MTSGYVCVLTGSKVDKVAYLSSDAYLSWYGLAILEAITKNNLDKYLDGIIEDIRAKYSKDYNPCDGFCLDWIRESKSSRSNGFTRKDYEEYGYIVEAKTGILKVYKVGKLIFTVRPEEREKYLYYFEHYSEIDAFLCYDASKLTYDWRKSPKNAVKEASLTQLKEWVELSSEERDVLDDTHFLLRGSSTENPIYGKSYGTSKMMELVQFFVYKPYLSNKWGIMVQLPFEKAVIRKEFSSEKKAVEEIRNIIRKTDRAAFRKFAELSDKLVNAYKNSHFEELRTLLDELETIYDEQPWFLSESEFSIEKIRKHYSYLF